MESTGNGLAGGLERVPPLVLSRPHSDRMLVKLATAHAKMHGVSGYAAIVWIAEHATVAKHEKSCEHEIQVCDETRRERVAFAREWNRETRAAHEIGTGLREPCRELGVQYTRMDGTKTLHGRTMHNAKGTREPNRAPPSRGVIDLGKARMATLENDCQLPECRNPELTNMGKVLPNRTVIM